MRLTALGDDRENEFDLDIPTAVREYEQRDALRSIKWNNKFSPVNV